MKKLLLMFMYAALSVIFLIGCDCKKEITEAKRFGADSVRRMIRDSLELLAVEKLEWRKLQRKPVLSKEEPDPKNNPNNPPYDGHVHDDIKFKPLITREGRLEVGILDKVALNDEHTPVQSFIPYIMPKDLLTAPRRYRNVNGDVIEGHPHIVYELVTIPNINKTADGTWGDSLVVAIVKNVIYKDHPWEKKK
jgi:hypothetical protein